MSSRPKVSVWLPYIVRRGRANPVPLDREGKELRVTKIVVTGLLALVVLLGSSLAGAATTAAAAATAGTGPDDALAPTGAWQPLAEEESVWYAFRYEGDGSQIQVQLKVEPGDGASFAVWTPAEVQRWRAGLEVAPIGRGSADPSAPGALVWSGNFRQAGTYYAVVEHAGSQPGTVYYLLTISGEAVSLAASPEATSPPAEPEPKTQREPARSAAGSPAQPGGTLVFQTGMGGAIYTIDAGGSDLQRITTGMDPSWSPDGTLIAFNRWQEPRGVWLVDVETGDEWRLFDWPEPRWTTWSPDGGEILFSRQYGGRTESREFCFRGFCFTFPPHPNWKTGVVRLADGSFYEPAPPDAQVSQAPSWSPSGDQFVYDGEQGLSVQALDGEVRYQVTADARDTSPSYSPDGQQVAFVRRQHDHWEIYRVDADGGNLRRLTDTPDKPDGTVGNSVSPAWSPDGRHIAFLTDRSGAWEIWIMAANGSGQAPMFDTALDGLALDYAFVGERAIDWTP